MGSGYLLQTQEEELQRLPIPGREQFRQWPHASGTHARRPCRRQPCAAALVLRSGICEMTASVVSSSDAIDAAFCRADRTTFAGSITPA